MFADLHHLFIRVNPYVQLFIMMNEALLTEEQSAMPTVVLRSQSLWSSASSRLMMLADTTLPPPTRLQLCMLAMKTTLLASAGL